jgi:hypothetical protein
MLVCHYSKEDLADSFRVCNRVTFAFGVNSGGLQRLKMYVPLAAWHTGQKKARVRIPPGFKVFRGIM